MNKATTNTTIAHRALVILFGSTLAWGCGRSLETNALGVARGATDEPDKRDEPDQPGETSHSDEPDPSAPPADSASSPQLRLLEELAALPPRSPVESERIAPACETPSMTPLSSAQYGSAAARLVWDVETGECELVASDRTPSGMAGILTVRQRDQQTSLSSIGEWRFHASEDIPLDALVEGESVTIYPYLGQWQFVATLQHTAGQVQLKHFAYLRGDGPLDGGQRDDLEDRTPSDYKTPTLCAPAPEEEL